MFNSTSQDFDFGDNDRTETELTIAPQGAYFFADNFAGGLRLDFTFFGLLGGNNDNGNIIGAGPFVRYYIKQGFFGELGFSFVSSDPGQFPNPGQFEESRSGTFFTPRVGYAAFLNEHVSIEPSVFYAIGGGELFENIDVFSFEIAIGIYLHGNEQVDK